MRLRGGGDDRKSDVPSNANGKKASKGKGDDDESTTEKSNDIVTGIEKEDNKEASKTAEDAEQAGDVKEISRKAGHDEDAGSRTERSTKRTRRQYETHKDATWLMHFNEACGDFDEFL